MEVVQDTHVACAEAVRICCSAISRQLSCRAQASARTSLKASSRLVMAQDIPPQLADVRDAGDKNLGPWPHLVQRGKCAGHRGPEVFHRGHGVQGRGAKIVRAHQDGDILGALSGRGRRLVRQVGGLRPAHGVVDVFSPDSGAPAGAAVRSGWSPRRSGRHRWTRTAPDNRQAGSRQQAL